MKYLYIIYQYLIALPLLVVLTLFTALFTIVLAPWKNSRLVHMEQMLWARSFFWFVRLCQQPPVDARRVGDLRLLARGL